jgi:hypothetical protein
MADMTRDEMIKEINDWLKKIEDGGAAGGGLYAEATIPVDGQHIIQTATKWPGATYNIYSISVDVKVENPLDAAQVIPAYNYVDYAIAANGAISFTNNYTAPVKVKIKLSGPIKK